MRLTISAAAIAALASPVMAKTIVFDVDYENTAQEYYLATLRPTFSIPFTDKAEGLGCFATLDGTEVEGCEPGGGYNYLKTDTILPTVSARDPLTGTITFDTNAEKYLCTFDFFGACAADEALPFMSDGLIFRRVTVSDDSFEIIWGRNQSDKATIRDSGAFFVDESSGSIDLDGWLLSYQLGQGIGYSATATPAPIPLPAGFPLLIGAMGVLALTRRR